MCIKIFKPEEVCSYDIQRPLEEQLVGSEKVVVNFDPEDRDIDTFLNEVERLCKNGISANVNIEFNHKDFLQGARIKKKTVKLTDDLKVNEVIKLMAKVHNETEKKLEEIIDYCKEESCRVKP